MSDPATSVQRFQRWLRRHSRRHPWTPARLAFGLVLGTRARRERALCSNPFCSCADVSPACGEWMGIEGETGDRCPRCGAAREHHDDLAFPPHY